MGWMARSKLFYGLDGMFNMHLCFSILPGLRRFLRRELHMLTSQKAWNPEVNVEFPQLLADGEPSVCHNLLACFQVSEKAALQSDLLVTGTSSPYVQHKKSTAQR